MRIAIIPVMAACTAALVATASPAHADGNSFVADLQAQNVPMVQGPDKAIAAGYMVCSGLRSGLSPDRAAKVFGMGNAFGPAIVDAAQHELCPDTLHNTPRAQDSHPDTGSVPAPVPAVPNQ
jgi:hypothetical protein